MDAIEWPFYCYALGYFAGRTGGNPTAGELITETGQWNAGFQVGKKDSEHSKSGGGWTPTSERVPDVHVAVLGLWIPAPGGVADGGSFAVAERCDGYWHEYDDADHIFSDPSHWMPLPEPPKPSGGRPEWAEGCGQYPHCPCNKTRNCTEKGEPLSGRNSE